MLESKRTIPKKTKKAIDISKQKLETHFKTQYGRDGEEMSPQKINNDSKRIFFSPRTSAIHKVHRRVGDFITKQNAEVKKIEDKILRMAPNLKGLNHKIDKL